MNTETTALITGASSGIGLHLAYEFARHGHPLILVAPNQIELDAVAEDIRLTHEVAVYGIAADLEVFDSAQMVFDKIKERGVKIEILVNNAGHGYRGKFWEIPIEKDLSMIRLNIEAVLRMTKLFLPSMLERGHGRILNTASVAGFEPGPWLSVYHASKAFVLSWSEALATELKDTGVKVTALCPGPTDTDFFPKAGMENVRGFQKADVMAPQDVAKAGYEGFMKEDLFVVPGMMNKALVAARRVLSESAQASMNEKFYEEVPPEERKRKRGDIESKAAQEYAAERR
ncbi:SDR family NAD(P)-dependent oxidoreductase [Brevifollis gellanilyticus]|uniref:Short-chain dehydrogenase n=1 Tax=Brevifollis gellanilyticus TaxID=748831 RepID=A0A512M2H8_9BACT|nr:SDR family oxidoreductase [Brevifollis gellanilyticus]GEP40944.1 short-chain dehydrogenase [Brevifollis gellanilyticus]